MASTYVNDLRLNEMATGDGSGTWGTTTNTNLELVGEAMGYGTEAVANASTHTITMADGATDGFRCTFLRLTGGGQICTVTLAPNTLSHTWIIRNTTGYALTLTQGSGANVVIAAGLVKAVTTDGLGAGAVVYECLYDLELGGKLRVSGDVTYATGADVITESAGTSNLRLGVGAGDSIASGGDYNVVVGDNAGTAITTGANNTAVGYAALDANTTASNNVAVGLNALGANTTGIQNVAVGYNALDANTTADNNTAVGASALGANTTGTQNVAVGLNALSANTTANYNAAMGTNALGVNTTGAQNVAVGQSALGASTTADNNTAVGMSALGANTTGGSNVAVGTSALAANTTAANNTAIGHAALGANTTGSQNVAVGLNSLDANTTGTLNTAVGQSALGANTTASNNVAVGVNALTANTTGAQNVAVGVSALFANTTANYNVAFGTNALLDVTTGILNVGVGHQSGSGALTAGQLTTGTGNIFIGYRACGTVAAQNYGTALGYDVEGAAGYTTVGQSTSDIRAAHGVATWAVVSDQRYKKDIADSTAGLDFVNALRPRTFKYRTLGELPETFRAYEAGSTEVFKNSNTNHGFIAQEVKAAIDADSSIKDGFRLWDDREDGSQEVAEAALIPVLVKAVQELSAQVNSLTTRLEALEGR
jgi:trimeric autotransporter adhesin